MNLYLIEFYTQQGGVKGWDIHFAWVGAKDRAEARKKVSRIRNFDEVIQITEQHTIVPLGIPFKSLHQIDAKGFARRERNPSGWTEDSLKDSIARVEKDVRELERDIRKTKISELKSYLNNRLRLSQGRLDQLKGWLSDMRKKNPDIHIDIHSHNTKGRNVRAKNPSRGRYDPAAAHELFLSAVNDANLYRQQIEPIIKNLRKKILKGTYKSDLALKLWRYAADTAAKRYTHGGYGVGKGYGIFTVPIREETAKELAEHYSSSLHEKNPVPPLKFSNSSYRVEKKVSGKWRTVGYFASAPDAKEFARFAATLHNNQYRVLELR